LVGVHALASSIAWTKYTTGASHDAKTDLAHQHLQAQLKAKTARREYLGVSTALLALIEELLSSQLLVIPPTVKKWL
jgi:hypothetical protein